MAGIKTQTRRERGLKEINENPGDWSLFSRTNDLGSNYVGFIKINGRAKTYTSIKCPYGNIGDVLWVRETWAKESAIFEDTERKTIYRADDHVADSEITWKPSIHMPKDAARQWLRITGIRVERLFSISEEDAKAEGIKFHQSYGERYLTGWGFEWTDKIGYASIECVCATAAEAYKELLTYMHGSAWVEANPWLWVIEYEVLSTTGKPSETVIARNEAISNQ